VYTPLYMCSSNLTSKELIKIEVTKLKPGQDQLSKYLKLIQIFTSVVNLPLVYR